MIETLNYKPNIKNLSILFLVALLLRLITFVGFVAHKERYKQPDSNDYHSCAISMGIGRGMHRIDNNKPIFWRTPGYPLYLSYFYNIFGIKSPRFSDNKTAQVTALLFQILLSSLLPILIFFLAFLLTKSLQISWITAWISAFHVGLVLASTYLLTEALTLLLFMPFLIYFYKSFSSHGQIGENKLLRYIILSALFLGLATWLRPMGQFLSIACMIIISLADIYASWGFRFKKAILFYGIFFLTTMGWCIRNYNLTGQWFFCPMSGLYLNSFPAPKIMRDFTGRPLIDCFKELQQKAAMYHYQKIQNNKPSGKHLVGEIIAGKAAWPVITAHPFLFIKNWIQEVIKTTFDLHSSLLVEFAKNTFYYDPLEEFLTEKIAECLYTQKMHPFMRIIAYIELLFSILIWIGLLCGAWLFLLFPLIKRFNVSDIIKKTGILWLKVAPMIGAVIIMTGGFGYARLRLPVDPLMIILSLTFWYWMLRKKK